MQAWPSMNTCGWLGFGCMHELFRVPAEECTSNSFWVTCAGSGMEVTPETEARMWATVTDKLLRSMATENEWRFPSRHLLQEDVTGTG